MVLRSALTALLLAVCTTACTDALASPPHRALPTVYGGSTSDDAPFGLQLSKDHRRLVQLIVHAQADCPSGRHTFVSEAIPFAARRPASVTANTIGGNRLPASGAFSLHGAGVQNYGDSGGVVEEDVTGRIRGRAAKGTFRFAVAIIDHASGATVETCSSDTLQWHATAAPKRIFIGVSASRQPVVVALTADRLQIADLRIAWSAACDPAGTLMVGDHLMHFRIAPSGSFGGAFDAGPYPNGDGSAAAFHYEVHGTVARTATSGTLAATFTLRDASGATTTCTLPAERWKALG
jgi:hypothetical protein